ncbi:hypothetical protein DLE60_31045 [Micromonospora globispora]|nr:alpha/beta hydrolase fold domain-containing protein [Micromonospora globispora]PWU53186.1 hypothetical protein DLE60_31045 [Micromonospora globispora]
MIAWTSSGGRQPAVVRASASQDLPSSWATALAGTLPRSPACAYATRGGPLPAAQVLVYPNTDLTLSYPSTQTKATGWGLTTDDVEWGAEQWVPDPSRRAEPEVSPVFAADLGGLPPTVVVTAEHDPLRDEGDAYAARVAAADVPARHRCEAGMVHGFLTLDTISPAAAAAGDRVFPDVADLRHSYATELVSRGVPVNDVQAVMGHEKPSTTLNLYTHRSDGRDQRIREAFADDPLTSSDD